MKKRLATTLLVSSLAFVSLVGCGSSTTTAANPAPNNSGKADTGGKITIGVAMPTFDDVWLNYLRHAMEQYATKNPNIKLIFSDANNDSSKQLSEVDNFIAEKVKSIVVVPVDPKSMQPILDAANHAKVPLVAVNREFPNMDQATAYVGSQSIQAGILEMTQIAKLLHGKGNIAIMEGQLGQEAEVDRTKGYYEVLKKYPDIHVVLKGTASWDRAKGMSLMENWLHSGKQINAVVSNNDEMAIGAIRAVSAAGMQGKIIVGGTDATPEGLSYVKNGQLAVSVYQSALGQGQDGIKLAYEAAKGEKVQKTDYVPYELVTKDNADKYLAVWKQLGAK
ncbi:sugar ABC transporter substrate-binding protein [Fodinisporobacter ferrooxydans]|uniref:Sugar ABC transporter substrate-binding protein n=1 Tax=Fodinisporobacter ferrooxydans TaxID=2901836 RepID=A0ABY4CIL0_9BACL|nr:sugar ABC transporter substrate-binding protein [Alicyclobacillaceae bacterium MYW30-H2]